MVRDKLMSPRSLVTAGIAVGLLTGPAVATNAPSDVGELSPLIPLPKDAIHAGLSWTKDSQPKICFGMRPAEYVGHHLVDEDGGLREEFEHFVYGGYNFSTGPHGLDQSVANGAVDRDNFVCLGPDASRRLQGHRRVQHPRRRR